MEMESTSRCIATNICRLSLTWEAPTSFFFILYTTLLTPHVLHCYLFNSIVLLTHCSLLQSLLLTETLQVRPVYSFYRFRTNPLKTTLVTSQLHHPLHSNGLLRMDQPTENPASRALQYCCVVTYCWLQWKWNQQAVA
jgi:hypothetical protein